MRRRNANANGYRDVHAYSYSNGDSNVYTNGDSDGHSNCYGYSDADSDSNGPAEAYPDAEAASDASASSVGLTGFSKVGTREKNSRVPRLRWIGFSEDDGSMNRRRAKYQAARPQSLWQRVEDNAFHL